MAKKKEAPDSAAERDRSHAPPEDPERKVEGREVEVEVVKTETVTTPDYTIRPEQTPRKREHAEEPDSDQARGDDLRPADIDNAIVRGEIPDPLETKKGK